MSTTIIYTTENRIDEELANFCRKNLLITSEGKRIISVSQKPLDFGENICMDWLPYHWSSIYEQMHEGLKQVKTKYVAIVEHDCLYTPEHFNWIPPDDSVFYYNHHLWFLQWGGRRHGTYSRMKERNPVTSQMLCSADLMREYFGERVFLVKNGAELLKKDGILDPNETQIFNKLKELKGTSAHKGLIKILDIHEKKFKLGRFDNKLPNIDIRHKGNYTGGRMAGDKCLELPYWGKIEDIVKMNDSA